MKANMLSVIRIDLLYLQTVLIIAGPGGTIYNSNASTVSKHQFMVNFIFSVSLESKHVDT